MVISKLKAGDRVWSVVRTKLGNTRLSTVSVYQVYIVEVHDDHVIASWNGNQQKRYGLKDIKAWKEDKPVLVRLNFGIQRLATKGEIEAMSKEHNHG